MANKCCKTSQLLVCFEQVDDMAGLGEAIVQPNWIFCNQFQQQHAKRKHLPPLTTCASYAARKSVVRAMSREYINHKIISSPLQFKIMQQQKTTYMATTILMLQLLAITQPNILKSDSKKLLHFLDSGRSRFFTLLHTT